MLGSFYVSNIAVLDEAFDRNGDDISKALDDYSKHRNPDAEAICDLAMYNYIEVCRHYYINNINKRTGDTKKKMNGIFHFYGKSK